MPSVLKIEFCTAWKCANTWHVVCHVYPIYIVPLLRQIKRTPTNCSVDRPSGKSAPTSVSETLHWTNSPDHDTSNILIFSFSDAILKSNEVHYIANQANAFEPKGSIFFRFSILLFIYYVTSSVFIIYKNIETPIVAL